MLSSDIIGPVHPEIFDLKELKMLSVMCVISGLSIIAASGIPALFFSSSSISAHRLTVLLFIAGSLLGISGTVMALYSPIPFVLSYNWVLPFGQFSVSVDKLSAFFLFLIFIIPALGSVYSLGYWKQSEHPENGHKLGLFYGLLVGSMAMVVISHDGVLFLIAWEIMALSAFFVLTTEDEKSEVRKTGWIYLVCTHIGTLLLFALFTFWNKATGSFLLEMASALPSGVSSVLFLLTFLAFSFKAGFIPFHIWLPGAHANAPSHVSAIMSGVLLKIGIYGIIRMTGLLPVIEPWWGAVFLAVGAFTGLFGITFALAQRDFKRILAYSSIENIGIIGMGIGLALLGRAFAKPELIILGMGGSLFHVWNHALFKSLLFFNSGAVIHATHTRDIEQMGGLAKSMPFTALFFIIGALAISALPPLNGFAGEWLLYIGLFKTLGLSQIPDLAFAGFASVALAMIGTLAVATFVRMYSTVFLGSSRFPLHDPVQDSVKSMQIPMAIVSVICICLGVIPVLVAPFLDGAVRAWVPLVGLSVSVFDLAPVSWLTTIGFSLFVFFAVYALWMKIAKTKHATQKGITWDCGYSEPTARMQYTGTSFTRTIVNLLSFMLQPKIREREKMVHFPEKKIFHTSFPDLVLDRLVLPFFELCNKIVPRMYVFQQGQTHLYVLYILLMIIALFVCSGIGVGL